MDERPRDHALGEIGRHQGHGSSPSTMRTMPSDDRQRGLVAARVRLEHARVAGRVVEQHARLAIALHAPHRRRHALGQAGRARRSGPSASPSRSSGPARAPAGPGSASPGLAALTDVLIGGPPSSSREHAPAGRAASATRARCGARPPPASSAGSATRTPRRPPPAPRPARADPRRPARVRAVHRLEELPRQLRERAGRARDRGRSPPRGSLPRREGPPRGRRSRARRDAPRFARE